MNMSWQDVPSFMPNAACLRPPYICAGIRPRWVSPWPVSPGGHTLLPEIYAFASGVSTTVPSAIPRFGKFCVPGRAHEDNHGGQLHPYQ